MPFHSTKTLEEAMNLVVLYCRLGWDGHYRILMDWSEQDILAAMTSARRTFNLEE